jgi:hypothetical protein
MYRFSIIDDAIMEEQADQQDPQEEKSEAEPSNHPENFLQKSAFFLHQVVNQRNSIRIFISKN